MKKTVEFNTRFNLGDIVYGIDINNKSTKAKITSIVYNKKERSWLYWEAGLLVAGKMQVV